MGLGFVLLALPALVLIAAAGLVAWRYNPTRKAIRRGLDPGWRRRARVCTFPPEAEAAEERDLYVASSALRDGCDVIWDSDRAEPPPELSRPLAHGTVVFVNSALVNRFIAEVFPRSTGRFVLVTGHEDTSTAEFDAETLMADGRVLHWFVENFDLDRKWLTSGRVSPLPIGLDYHKLNPDSQRKGLDMGLPSRPGNQQLTMKAIAAGIGPVRDRPLKVYANFHLNMDTFLRHRHAERRYIARREAIDGLTGKDFMLWEPRQAPRNQVWQRHAEALFEASPRGNGIDCHRTWEAFFLKSIPILRHSSIDPVFDGLPVAFVDDWSEVTAERLAAWRDEFAGWFDRPLPEKLFTGHWLARFHAFKPAGDDAPAPQGTPSE